VSPTPEFESLVPEQPFSRRDFIVTGLGAGFALAVQPVMAQTAIQTDTRGLIAGEIKVPVKDGEMAAYRAQPAEGNKLPTILVVSEIFGVHEYIKDICRRLAKVGYLAVAPELFARQGDPRQISGIAEIQEKITSRTPDTQVISDLDDTAAWAMKNGGDPERLGITGFCWGGRMTWLCCAHNPRLKAGVAWYGRLVGNVTEFTPRYPTDVAAELRAPVLGLYGGLDAGIPRDTVEVMERRLKAAENPNSNASQIIIYDNAPHAFHADYRPSFRKDEAEDGWRRMQDWFKKHGV
jgi:carboxymethylenebutenolidase